MMKKIYIVLFALLYFCIACISCIHSYEFFGLANSNSMAIVLSAAFEIGQAAVLFALLTSEKERVKIMPWVLMVIFTLVQIMGNIYACYKYIMINSQYLLQYFKDPIFVWTNLPDNQATVIVTYVVSAILPICGLLLTSMVTNYISKDDEPKQNKEEKQEEQEITVEEKENEDRNEQQQIPQIRIDKEPQEVLNNVITPPIEDIKEDYEQEVEEEEPIIINEEVEDLLSGSIPQENIPDYPKKKSQFINI